MTSSLTRDICRKDGDRRRANPGGIYILGWTGGYTLPAILLVIDGLTRIAIRPGVLRDMPPTSMVGHGNAPGHQKKRPKETLGWPTTKIILKTWRRTMQTSLEKRLQNLEDDSDQFCLHCTALAALSEEELDIRIQGFASGQGLPVDGEPVEYDHVMVKGDLNLSQSRLQTNITSPIRINDSTFDGFVSFNDSNLDESIDLSGSNFTKDAYFRSATFSGNAYFMSATFSRNAYFGRATFSRNAYFGRATFSHDQASAEANRPAIHPQAPEQESHHQA
jgi:hypothetical protein